MEHFLNVKASNSITIKFWKNSAGINVSFSVNQLQTNDTLNYLSQHEKSIKLNCFPNRHILVIRRRNSTWKVRRNYIDFKRQIHVEIMTSIRRGNFDVDSTFKLSKISMRVLHVDFSRLFQPVLSYSGIVLSRCDFNNIDVITDIGTIGTISFGNFCNNATKYE